MAQGKKTTEKDLTKKIRNLETNLADFKSLQANDLGLLTLFLLEFEFSIPLEQIKERQNEQVLFHILKKIG